MPPSLHWAVVLILALFTGIFGLVWMFIQAGYVKKIDPQSSARKLLWLGLLCYLGYVVLAFGGVVMAYAAQSQSMMLAAAGLGGILAIAGGILFLVAVFSMRRSLVHYFNTVEPIGLKLNGVLTFFFNILYFQYHLSRIAEWKKTGVLA